MEWEMMNKVAHVSLKYSTSQFVAFRKRKKEFFFNLQHLN